MTHLEEYFSIINFRKSNPLPEDQYGERHHVVPKSICPLLEKVKSNIVKLSGQEHFMAHYHLWKAFRDELHEKKWAKKMCFALHRMKQQLLKCDDIEAMSKLYEETRIDCCKYNSERMCGNSFFKGKYHSAESKKKMADAHKGRKHTYETKMKLGVSVCQYSKDGQLIAEYKSLHEAEEQTGTPEPNISNVCRGVRPYANGYVWKYKNNRQSG